jgi:uncharacterized sodium:solute symporter family permease YidK
MKLPDFILRFIGRRISDKLNLKEDKNMDTKPWYQSKGVITGIVTGLMGIYLSLAPQLHWPAVPNWIFSILGAIGVYARVSADTKIG